MIEARSPANNPLARILIVDDELNLRSMLAQAFRALGYEIEDVGSGSKALRLLQQQPYDLMILDMNMPVMDGIEVMRRARELSPDLSIIVLTGHASVTSAIEAIRANADDYLTKPSSVHQIAEAASRALEKRSKELRQRRLVRAALDVLQEPQETGAPPSTSNSDTASAKSKSASANLSDTSGRYLQVGPFTLDRQKRSVITSDQPSRTAELTEGEMSVLELLMLHPDEVLSCRELASTVWDYAADEWEAQGVIRPYICRLRQKLEQVPDEPRFIRTVRRRGYLLECS